jgi:hypothetical protein
LKSISSTLLGYRSIDTAILREINIIIFLT